MLKTKRVYEAATQSGGHRILVDRLWPRGVRKEDAALDEWMKDIAPSTDLRLWFGHDPKRWPEFQLRYRKELRAREDLLRAVARRASAGTVTLLYAAKDEVHNHAAVLAAAIRPRLVRERGAAHRPARTARARGAAPRPGTQRTR